MFDRREDLVRLLAVAEAGKIQAAAAQLAMTQPALTRTVARLERQCGGRLFERLPTGVRPTPFGEQVITLARGVLREIANAEDTIGMAVSGRAGKFRVTATPMWMEAVLAPSAAWLRERLPALELAFRTVTPPEGLRLLEAGRSDLHCGGLREEVTLPDYLRCERFLDMTGGIVARDGHPLLDAAPAPRDLAAAPWIDFDADGCTESGPTVLTGLLDRLFRETGRHVLGLVRAGSAGLCLLASGPWLAWLPLGFLDRPGRLRFRALPTDYGRRRYRTGFVARRAAEDLEPFRLLEERIRDVALGRGRPAGD